MLRDISAILLIDSKHKVLLQHKDAGAPVLANQWAFFGGGIEKGEKPEEAVRREIMEELEYQLSAPVFLGSFEFKIETVYGTMHLFGERYDPKQKLIQHEGDKMGWFSIDEAVKLGMIPFNNEVLIKIRNRLYLVE